ncbi:Molybdenum cofactor biosynthesis protein A [Sugiyamaella lignohabitans]|uniref:GTP 3',8-cyclase n=1 Tax=Sugiyamaella lignohabitans TaxID=796027 RepID=A0A167CER7_9ASCO|nr:Molybdenum cofactor biosynthesis protein A [Sugiyamaella lignohabitans]ANB11595.1 Molybdenum cofactor biosynthesis protein A [Sugiyamaella lignohabitans]
MTRLVSWSPLAYTIKRATGVRTGLIKSSLLRTSGTRWIMTETDVSPVSRKLQWEAIRSAKPFSEFLTDTFGREHDYLRISISERCNLRCIYCMPEEGVELSPSADLLTKDEILKIAKLFVSQGVRKIRLTGGEPSVRKDFIDIVKGLGEIPGLEEIAITSNGIALGRKIPLLKQYGVTSLNLSLDTLVEGKFMIMTRRAGLSKVLNTLDQALRQGIPKVKLNVVVMKGVNDDEILDFVRIAKEKPVEVRFIEYMPFSGNKWSTEKMVSYHDMLSLIHSQYPSLTQVAASRGDTAKIFTDPRGHFAGKVGFITSMTSHFCGSCNRLRITSDGNLKVCLFGNTEVSLRDMVRKGASDHELLEIIGSAVKNKKAKHAGIGELEKMENRPMILIGGLV